jgi:pimeloyl-ACP methyl ester carboxylesterase
LVIYGNKSGYVQQKDKELFSKTFTDLDFLEIEGGHWIHAEKPEAFVEGVKHFLEK